MSEKTSWRWLLVLLLLLPPLAGCGGGGGAAPIIIEPGLVGIDDRPAVALTAPELTVEYARPGVAGTFVVRLLSDQQSDGDIAFDSVQNSFTITRGPDTLWFGIDFGAPNQPEYRAFLDFPLDGSTGEAVIPFDASILSATLTVFVNFVDYSAAVPVLLDLVQYSVTTGLAPTDYFSDPLAVRAFEIFNSDTGRDVNIDVTGLLREAQLRRLAEFQLRFLLGP